MSTDSTILHTSSDNLLDAMQNLALSPSTATDTTSSDNSRPFISYTQAQILFLHKSPLVSPPQGMPVFKDWFGYAHISAFSTITVLSYPSETGMNKTPQKRTLKPRRPQERGTNGMSYLEHDSLLYLYNLSTLASDVIKKMQVRSPSLPSMSIHSLQPFSGSSPACHLQVDIVSTLTNG
jgi:hypothetical protein